MFRHWTNGDGYTGDWRAGVPHGHGEFRHGGQRAGEKYVGQYQQVGNTAIWCSLTGCAMQGFRSGYGTFYYPDGRSFVGSWENDQREGPGVLYYPEGFRWKMLF